ncbi:acyltransferase family protein [Bradyrhizobium erythrophlei]|uniref:acyltransferase family protein n=1 Tax=Bradyrhizobium erythrophlei TaxID=1437360 RepID=UPI0009A5AD30|nr:acyltransferase [Bradyrhizobium erythrophlei]
MPTGSRLWDPLWSLSVEEVFYLCFPALLLFVRNRGILIAGLVGLAIIGPFWRAQTVQPYPYLCNFDGIALGAIVALGLAMTKSWDQSRPLLRCLRYAGAILIGANFIWTQDTIASLTWGPTLMGIGSAVYLLGTARSDARRFFAFMPLEKLGELSYEIYLSHMFVIIALHPIFMSSFTNTDPRMQIAMGDIWPVLLLVALLFGSRLIARFYSEPANRFIKSGRWEVARSVDQIAEKYSAL